MWWWSQRRQDAVLGFTRRGDGRSVGRHRGRNLGLHVGDDPAVVEHNRQTVLDAVSALSGIEPAMVRPVFMNQVHGATVRVIESPQDVSRIAPNVGVDSCDAVVTTVPHLALFTLVADCTPVLFTDPDAGVVAAAHAGRPGMLAEVVPATIEAMRDLGADQIEAVVGPSVCARCYEVPEEMRAAAMTLEPVSAGVSWTGTAAIDVAAGVVAQLHRAHVTVTWVAGCTRESDDLYSYRRDGPTGRFAGVVMRVPDMALTASAPEVSGSAVQNGGSEESHD